MASAYRKALSKSSSAKALSTRMCVAAVIIWPAPRETAQDVIASAVSTAEPTSLRAAATSAFSYRKYQV